MSIVSGIAKASLHPQLLLLLFDTHKTSALSHSGTTIGYAGCLCLVFDEDFANGYSISLLHIPYFRSFPFVRIVTKILSPTIKFAFQVKGGVTTNSRPYFGKCLPVCYSLPCCCCFVVLGFQMCLNPSLFLVHACCWLAVVASLPPCLFVGDPVRPRCLVPCALSGLLKCLCNLCPSCRK